MVMYPYLYVMQLRSQHAGAVVWDAEASVVAPLGGGGLSLEEGLSTPLYSFSMGDHGAFFSSAIFLSQNELKTEPRSWLCGTSDIVCMGAVAHSRVSGRFKPSVGTNL